MIQPTVSGVFLMQITQNNMPSAPKSAHRRSNSCPHLVFLTLDFVRGLIGFQSRLPYGLCRTSVYISQEGHTECTHTMKYESGCLLNSLVSIRGPSWLGLGLGGNRLACDAALGLKPFSVGPVKEYREGGS